VTCPTRRGLAPRPGAGPEADAVPRSGRASLVKSRSGESARGRDILVERNEAGDANLEMLPPPDGSARIPARVVPCACARLPLSVDRRDRGAGLGADNRRGRRPAPVVLEVANARCDRQRPTNRFRSRGDSAPPGQFVQPRRHGRNVRWLDQGLPGNIDLQGEFGDARSRSRVASGSRARTSRLRPKVLMWRYSALHPTAGAARRPLCVERQAATQRNGFKVEVTALKVERANLSASAVPGGSQGRSYSRGQRRHRPA